MKIRIVKEGHWFDEIASLLLLVCSEFSDCSVGEIEEDSLNILLGYQLLKVEVKENVKIVIYQLEQLSSNVWLVLSRLELFKRALVWDYDPSNVVVLRRLGINAEFMPIGFHYGLKRKVFESKVKEFDVGFYGTINDRREFVLSELGKFCKVAIVNRFGSQRDEVIAKCKLVVNVHYYEDCLLEQVRLFYLIGNAVPVLSESSKVNLYNIPHAKYDDIPNLVRFYLKRFNLLKLIMENAQVDLCRLKMKEMIKNSLYGVCE